MLIEGADVKRGCLAGEVAVITGAGRGIGRETALALAYLGASIAIAEIADSGRQTQDDIRVAGGRALWVRADISEPRDWQVVHDRVIEEWGRVDILINNAEAVCPKAVIEHSLEEWERVFAVNCRGVFLPLKLFLPAMLERRHGTVVFMPSAQGIPFAGAYSASKAAQESLSASLAQEVGPSSGVSVITFGVGMVDTPATAEYVPVLASRLGMSPPAFIEMAAPGGHMASAELVATGLAGVIVHAAGLHGRQVDWPSGLARIGLTAAGLRIGEAEASAPPGEHELTSVSPDLASAAAKVEGVIEELRSEYEDLGAFQKQWYRRTIRRRTGLDIDGWEAASSAAAAAVKQGLGLDPAYAGQLRRLDDHLLRSEADWRGYVSEPDKLRRGIEVLERRRAAVRSLLDALVEERAPAAVS